uniref:Isopenicillin N synthase-like Fe(2+) 2OG dioxygenase domain-containing protein n=1 Tax=Electrophorus electricus TaxID=8005 RepID=A0A4W4FD97_ELEEL
MDLIPVIDFDVYRLGLGEEWGGGAFFEVGFVYLKNSFGMFSPVENVIAISFTFASKHSKSSFKRGGYANSINHGWFLNRDRKVWLSISLNPLRPGDLKEAFNTVLMVFRGIQMSFFLRRKELTLRVLRVMALSLGLESSVFLKAHKCIGSDTNGTTLRSLHYPPVKSEHVKVGQIRCGEHSDYGTITLVFQSHEDGLQVLSRKGEYVSVPSIPGAVLINTADLMQRLDSLMVLLPPLVIQAHACHWLSLCRWMTRPSSLVMEQTSTLQRGQKITSWKDSRTCMAEI